MHSSLWFTSVFNRYLIFSFKPKKLDVGKRENTGEIRNAFIILVENLKIREILDDVVRDWNTKLK
jgi:hypothetical protein